MVRLITIVVFFMVAVCKCLFCEGLVSEWGEPCGTTQDCNDHRYVCKAEDDDNVKRCVCDRFHEWRGETVGCLPKYNTTTILKIVAGKSSISEEERDNAIGSAFIVQWVAGIFVFITVLLASFSVIIYCWYIRKKDRALRLEVEVLINRKKREGAGSSAGV